MIRKLTETVFQGDINYTEDDLRQNGISVIVNLCETDKRPPPDVLYIHIPIPDCSPIPRIIVEIVKLLMASKKKLLVHCCVGRSRSVRVTQLALGLSLEEFEKRYGIKPPCPESQPLTD